MRWRGCDDGLSSDGSDRKVASAPFSFEEAVAVQTRLVVEAINGPITITGVAGADVVTVEGTREARAETEAEAQQGVTELQVEVEALAEEIIVETLQPEEPDPRDFVVNYEISLPPNLAVVEVSMRTLPGIVAEYRRVGDRLRKRYPSAAHFHPAADGVDEDLERAELGFDCMPQGGERSFPDEELGLSMGLRIELAECLREVRGFREDF